MSLDEYLSVHEWHCGRNLNYFLCTILYWTRVAAAAHASLSLKCRIRGRKSYFRQVSCLTKWKYDPKHISSFIDSFCSVFDWFREGLDRFAYIEPKVVGADKDMPSIWILGHQNSCRQQPAKIQRLSYTSIGHDRRWRLLFGLYPLNSQLHEFLLRFRMEFSITCEYFMANSCC